MLPRDLRLRAGEEVKDIALRKASIEPMSHRTSSPTHQRDVSARSQAILSRAMEHHQAGRISEAEHTYREILTTDPDHADALHLLGLLAYQASDYTGAVTLIRRAIMSNQRVAPYYSHLGLALHMQGKFEEAVAAYEQALQLNPEFAEAHSNLGNILQAQGEIDAAVRRYKRALEIKPDYAEACSNLGNALTIQGELDEAVHYCNKALAINPMLAEAYNNLATALRAQGYIADAILRYKEAIALRDDYVAARYNLGVLLQLQGQLENASVEYLKVLTLRPEHIQAHYNLGVLYQSQGNHDEASRHLYTAIGLNPDYFQAYNNLGAILELQGKTDEAVDHYRRALALNPTFAEAYYNLGHALQDQGLLDDAIANYQQALKLKQDYVEACNNLGAIFELQGRLADAVTHYKQTITLKPDHAGAKLNLALLQLLLGDIAGGFNNYEWRWHSLCTPRGFSQRQWRGEPLNGARILLYAEQGLGDTLQFLRFLPMVQAAGGCVILEVQAPLRRIAEQLTGVSAFVTCGEPIPPFDWQCPLMSLPSALGITSTTVPGPRCYLSVPEDALRKTRMLPWPKQGLKIGIVWAGNPSHTKDRYRSLPLSLLEPMLRMEGIHFYSLQMGQERAQLAVCKAPITDLCEGIEDIADTAALMTHLDLLIAVDTSVVHLAGALGKPVWVMLPSAPDWRWMLHREDSPWYPTMRLFRQTRLNDWGGVVRRVCEQLSILTGSRHALGGDSCND
jgi:tetratricopeptide (TPR) repeat protein